MSISHKIAVALFALMITLPFIGEYAVHGSNNGKVIASEKRKVTPYQELPALKKRAVKAYFQNLDRYIADRLMYKDQAVRLMMDVTGNPERYFHYDLDKGMIGSGGYVFLGNRYANVIERHFHQNFTLNEDATAGMLKMHAGLRDAASEVGGDYTLFVAPNKHGIYCEFFNDQIKDPGACTRQDRITRNLIGKLEEQGINVVYPFDSLRQRRDERIYWKTDTHWNLKGAGYGFQALIESLNANGSTHSAYSLQIPGYVVTPSQRMGDLGAIVGLSRDFPIDDVSYELTYDPAVRWKVKGGDFELRPNHEAEASGPRKWICDMENSQAVNHARLLVFGDSFLANLSHHLNLHFSHIRYASHGRSPEEIRQMIMEFRPDHVIYEIVERNML